MNFVALTLFPHCTLAAKRRHPDIYILLYLVPVMYTERNFLVYKSILGTQGTKFWKRFSSAVRNLR